MVEEIIHKDAKLLLRFLKEKHLFLEYKKKFSSTLEKRKTIINYNSLYNYFLKYYRFYPITTAFNDMFVLTNTSLLLNVYLFANWYERPFIFHNMPDREAKKWNIIYEQYCSFKKVLALLYKKLKDENNL